MTYSLQYNDDVAEAMKDSQLLTKKNLNNLEIAQMMFIHGKKKA